MSEVRCFMILPLDEAEHGLRRYTLSDTDRCPGTGGYHSAYVAIGRVPFESPWDGSGDDRHPHEDPRWPHKCDACEYHFAASDYWQNSLDRLYRGPDGDYTGKDAPAGAMRLTWWDGNTSSAECLARGERDHLKVKLPDATWWDIDAPASKDYREGGSGWTREGEPPLVTANPSILTGRYHGWLRNGVLVDC